MSSQTTTGMVLGKFYPLHKGHEYLISLAYHFVDELFVIVEQMPNESIPVSVRASWIQSLFINAKVITLSDFNPQHPNEHPNFWHIWKTSLQRIVPKELDYVFAGEPYGETLAKHLGAQFIGPGSRALHPVSGTKIRANPCAHWNMLATPVKEYYRKRVCICGPESTGKTTLSKSLAQHFDQNAQNCRSWVPEFARGYLLNLDRDICSTDLLNIAKGQAASEAALYSDSGPLQIIDTGVNASSIWHQFLLGKPHSALDEFCNQHKYDLYLLCSPDVPWVKDDVRYLPDQGWEFFQAMENHLKNLGVAFVVVSGSWEERRHTALRACNEILGL